jgi:hypothetical protein
MSDLRDYATQIASMSHGGLAYGLLLKYGEENTFTPLPEGEECGTAKGCYQNATHRVLFGRDGGFEADPDLTYYEGLVDSGILPIEHAWAQDNEGRVYELTLRHNDPDCAFCHGEGTLHPTDHWAYHATEEEDEFGYEGPEEMECEQCNGSGEGHVEDRTGTTYLGIAIPTDVLREAVLQNGVYGVLFSDPERVAEMLGEKAA